MDVLKKTEFPDPAHGHAYDKEGNMIINNTIKFSSSVT